MFPAGVLLKPELHWAPALRALKLHNKVPIAQSPQCAASSSVGRRRRGFASLLVARSAPATRGMRVLKTRGTQGDAVDICDYKRL